MQFFKVKKYFSLLVFFGFLFLILINSKLSVWANEDMDKFCEMERIESECNKISPAECRKILEKCDKYFQEKSAELEKGIAHTKEEKRTLQNQISLLQSKIKKLNYQIYQNNLMIKDLSFQINDTQASIEKTSLKIKDSKEKLSVILQEIYEQDQRSTLEILLGEDRLSDFFDNLVALEVLNSKNKELLEDIKKLKEN